MEKYSPEQIRRFQNRDKRIIVQSTLKAIMGDKGLNTFTEGAANDYLKMAFYITEKIVEKYPTDNDLDFSETVKYSDEPFPSTRVSLEKTTASKSDESNTPPTHCPECGAEVKYKSGVSKKTGKPYSFVGCSAYPDCKWVLK